MNDIPNVEPAVEERVGVTVNALCSFFILDGIKGFGPQKFKELHENGISPSEVVDHPQRLPTRGKRGDDFRADLTAKRESLRPTCLARAAKQILAAEKLGAHIVGYANPAYPKNVYHSNNPIPTLYVLGSLDVLSNSRAIACVGSRGIREPYAGMLERFAQRASEREFVIVSGFALGADTVGHRAAVDADGQTIAVMPCGLDRPFPPENKGFWKDLNVYPKATMVSEFPFGTAAKSLTLRKRNKLIVAFALGVLIGQSSVTGGAMNAFRFAKEQRKPIGTFAGDESDDTSGNRHISESTGAKTVTFSGADETEFERWLGKLSSSI